MMGITDHKFSRIDLLNDVNALVNTGYLDNGKRLSYFILKLAE